MKTKRRKNDDDDYFGPFLIALACLGIMFFVASVLITGFIQTIEYDQSVLQQFMVYIAYAQNIIHIQKTEIVTLQANLANKTSEISDLQSLLNNKEIILHNQSEEIYALKNLINTREAGNVSVSSSNSSVVICQVTK